MSLLYLDIAVGVDQEYQTYSWNQLMGDELPPEKSSHFYYLNTMHKRVPIPKVVVLNEFDRRPPQHVRFSRTQVFVRDGFTCQYCSKVLPKQKLNIDHVMPRMLGGKTAWENVVTSCHPCNRRKGGRTPAQAGMPLLIHPFKPSVSPTIRALKTANPSWQPFLLDHN